MTEKRFGGGRALLLFPSGLDFIAALFGCFYAGVAAVPVPHLPGKRGLERLRSIRDNSDPGVVLTLSNLESDIARREGLSEILTDLVQIRVDTLDAQAPKIDLSAPSPDSLALLQYTSGSTSSPKGVMLNHANLVANSAMIAEAFGHDRTLRGVSWLPLFHDMGLVGHVLQPIYLGGLSVLMSPQSFLQRPVRWLQAISNWRATTSGAPTYALDLCLKMVRDEQMEGLDLGSLTVLYCGSEMVHADVLERFSARFSPKGFRRRSLLPCFGLAEATLLVTGTRSAGLKTEHPVAPSSNGARPATSCGKPPQGSSIIVVDPDRRTALGDGVVGEIWVRGPHVGQGYWPGGPHSDDIFNASLADDPHYYLRTGDLGFINAGELYVTGRLKDTIIINGSKHSAEDIEAGANRSHPLLRGLTNAAFGIDFNDQERVVLVQEIGSAQLRSHELAEAVAQAFASVTRGHGIRLADLVLVRAGSLPRTSSGKISRSRARQLYLKDGFNRIGPIGASSTGDRLTPARPQS